MKADRPTLEEAREQHYAEGLLPRGSRVLVGRENLKIDLGCGRNKAAGFIGFDANPDSDADFLCNLNEGIPLEDDCCSHVIAGHFLEHVEDAEFTVYEMWRVSQAGAWVNINVPAVSWYGAYAIEHRSFIAEWFFTMNRCFKHLFRLTRMYYQCDPRALMVARKYIPGITADDAGMLFWNVRRQLLVEATPRHKGGEQDEREDEAGDQNLGRPPDGPPRGVLRGADLRAEGRGTPEVARREGDRGADVSPDPGADPDRG